MSCFGKNIRKIRNVKKLSQQSFAELFDLKRATLGAYEEERSEPRLETIMKIANHFSISIDDLLTQELTINKLLKYKEDLPFSSNHYNERLSEVPCIFPQLELEYIKKYQDLQFIKELPQLKLPLPANRKRRAFVISNSEMTIKNNGIFPNDMVVGEWLDKEKLEEINAGTVVLVITANRFILRKVTFQNDDIILSASSSGFDPIQIGLEDILEIWEIKNVFLNHIPNIESDLKGKLSYLEQEIKNLKQYL